METGSRPRATAMFGYRTRFRQDGLRTVTATGRGLRLGAGRGSMMLPGALRPSTTAVGSAGAEAGLGHRARLAIGIRITRPHWSAGLAARASVSALAGVAAGASVSTSDGSRWVGVNRSSRTTAVGAGVDGIAAAAGLAPATSAT